MIGQRLLHYEITQKLGEGGMGVVYKARDTHLDRFVALKLLPPDKVSDPARKARFVQEAKSASALNHPNIITIYDISSDAANEFIAMEYIAGKPLDQLIPRGGMRLSDALKLAIQIADALARAHAAGIVHRDLKPANIMVDGHGLVKVLDFGLAKLTEQAVSAADSTATIAVNTEEGSIVGTAGYMSPEQAEGKQVDARSDIFSLGAVLYEMVTGRKAFQGESRMSILMAVLREEPNPLPENVPQELQRVIARCLRKDPARRLQHAGDIKVALEDLKEEADSGDHAQPGGQQRSASRIWWFAGAAVVVAVSVGVLWHSLSPVPQPPTNYAAGPIALTSFPGSERYPTFSPEGDRIAFSWDGNSADPNDDIYVKLIGSENVQRLTTNQAPDLRPAWSPDGRHISFARLTENGYRLMLVPSIGGPERQIAEFLHGLNTGLNFAPGVAWTADSRWLVTEARELPHQPFSLIAIALETGEHHRLTSPPQTHWGDRLPAVSPDGRTLVFVRYQTEMASTARLFSLRLSENLQPEGEPVSIQTGLDSAFSPIWNPDGQSVVFSTSLDSAALVSRLYSVAASGGKAVPIERVGSPATYAAISRDGRRLAFARPIADSNLWRVDGLTEGNPQASEFRTINSTALDQFPQYSPDGKRVAFESSRSGAREIWAANVDGSNPVKLTSYGGPYVGAPRWSPDGAKICYLAEPAGQRDVYVVSPNGGPSRRLTDHAAKDTTPNYSREGKWLYFGSNRSGSQQVWRMPAEGGEAVQITKGGGAAAFESPDSKWLFYAMNDPGETSLWRMPIGGGAETRVIDSLLNHAAVCVTDHGVYFIPARRPVGTTGGDELRLYDPATGKVKRIVKLPGGTSWGITVSPDGKSMLYSQLDRGGSDLMLLENFR